MIAEGRFTRYKNKRSYAAVVEVELNMVTDGPFVTVQTDGNGFTSQGTIENTPRQGYDHWKAGAVAGVQYALQTCGNPAYGVVVRSIRGMHTDTNPTVVAAAAINAVWEALAFQPPDDVIACIEQKVFSSWSMPRDAVAIFC
jgi:hypothetical protein